MLFSFSASAPLSEFGDASALVLSELFAEALSVLPLVITELLLLLLPLLLSFAPLQPVSSIAIAKADIKNVFFFIVLPFPRNCRASILNNIISQ